jgi:hypothetical protein
MDALPEAGRKDCMRLSGQTGVWGDNICECVYLVTYIGTHKQHAFEENTRWCAFQSLRGKLTILRVPKDYSEEIYQDRASTAAFLGRNSWPRKSWKRLEQDFRKLTTRSCHP